MRIECSCRVGYVTSLLSMGLEIVLALVAAMAMVALAAPPSDPIFPGAENSTSANNEDGTVPSLPVEWQAMSCELDLTDVSFGGLQSACGGKHGIDKARCCPVLATWLYAAHADDVMQGPSVMMPQGPVEMPEPPDDSAVCAAQLEQGLEARGIKLPAPNTSCDVSTCLCGIRIRQLGSSSCPASYYHLHNNNTAMAVLVSPSNSSMSSGLEELERDCRDPSYSGCTRCLSALDHSLSTMEARERVMKTMRSSEKMDCRVMGLVWLLSRNRTRYIGTVTAVLRAIQYNAAHPSECIRDDSHMPLASDSHDVQISSSPLQNYRFSSWSSFIILIIMLIN